MRGVIAIARRDLRAYFSSPRAAAIFWFFLIFMGFFFNNFIHMFMQMTTQAPMMGGQAPTLEQLLKALFYNLHFILLLVVPAVTMASFSEEKRNQSIRLLQTAPCTALEIVLGKFFAAGALMGLVLLASAVYPLFTITHGNPDKMIIFFCWCPLSSRSGYGLAR